ncbi:MAG TPA: AraC family transcriptional regulator [Polyangiaceae bacterium]|nr:AraC family transcriptional regulator [Polyangiaceae bacterium]
MPEPEPVRRSNDLPLPSVLSSWTRIIVDALESLGMSADDVLEAAGVSRQALKDPNARLPMTSSAQLWKAAALKAGDPAFGLRASRYVKQTTFHALGYAVFASATLRDALHRLVRYSHLVSDGAELVLREEGDTVRLVFEPELGAPSPSVEALDAVMSLIVRTSRGLTDRSFSLHRVEQRRPEPADTYPYRRFFRCDIVFGAADNALTIGAQALDRPLLTSNPELALHNDHLVRRYLAEMRQGSMLDRVRAVLAERLTGDASPAAVAAALGTSVRSLQRRLRDQGFSYVALLNETRRQLATAYLLEERYSVTEIAFQLGFDDASAFARAFRRWTGLSPSDYRARASGQKADE